MKKKALIVGATGLVGSFLLKKLLQSNHYDQVVSLVRTPSHIQHKKLKQVVFNFDEPDKSQVVGDDIFCCLGTTIAKAGSKKAFRKVDLEYPLAIARIAHSNGAKQYAVVTSMGSNENSMVFYSKVKGELEQELKKITFKGLYIFRPSMLMGERQEKRWAESAAKIFMKLFSFAVPASVKGIHASKVANAMIHFVEKEKPGIHYINSATMQKF